MFKKEKEMETAAWEWENDGTHWCSECGYDALYECSCVEPYIYKESLSNVCPHCGRLMTEIRERD